MSTSPSPALPHIFVDADACPMKEEIYRVACRYRLGVTLVANTWMRIPEGDWLHLEVVPDQFDAADDWIVQHVSANDLVVTTDIPLAARCLEKGASVLGNSGVPFDENTIGEACAMRELMADLRNTGEMTGGPPPLTDRDRSRFLQAMDRILQQTLREAARS